MSNILQPTIFLTLRAGNTAAVGFAWDLDNLIVDSTIFNKYGPFNGYTSSILGSVTKLSSNSSPLEALFNACYIQTGDTVLTLVKNSSPLYMGGSSFTIESDQLSGGTFKAGGVWYSSFEQALIVSLAGSYWILPAASNVDTANDLVFAAGAYNYPSGPIGGKWRLRKALNGVTTDIYDDPTFDEMLVAIANDPLVV